MAPIYRGRFDRPKTIPSGNKTLESLTVSGQAMERVSTCLEFSVFQSYNLEAVSGGYVTQAISVLFLDGLD